MLLVPIIMIQPNQFLQIFKLMIYLHLKLPSLYSNGTEIIPLSPLPNFSIKQAKSRKV